MWMRSRQPAPVLREDRLEVGALQHPGGAVGAAVDVGADVADLVAPASSTTTFMTQTSPACGCRCPGTAPPELGGGRPRALRLLGPAPRLVAGQAERQRHAHHLVRPREGVQVEPVGPDVAARADEPPRTGPISRVATKR